MAIHDMSAPLPPRLLSTTQPTSDTAHAGVPSSSQATQQRRQAEELARPRPRTRASKNMISRAKAVACHRPTVVFGTSYRRDGDKHPSLSTKAAVTEPASTPPATKRSHVVFVVEEDRLLSGVSDEAARDREDKRTKSSSPTRELLSSGGEREGVVGSLHGGRGTGEIVRYADIIHAGAAKGRKSYGLPSATSMVGGTTTAANATSTKANAHAGRVPLGFDFGFPPEATDVLQRGSPPPSLPPPPPPPLTAAASFSRNPRSSTVGVVENQGPVSTIADAYRMSRPERGLVVGCGRGGSNAGAEPTVASRAGGGGENVETERPTEELVERWLRDVRLETDTAGTALKVGANYHAHDNQTNRPQSARWIYAACVSTSTFVWHR